MPRNDHERYSHAVPHTQDERVRAILGVHNGSLPAVEQESLRKYYEYLARTLSFPMRARYHEAVSLLEDITHSVTVVGLVDPSETIGDDGLVCRAIEDGKLIEVPLVELEVDRQGRNFQFVEDYWYWAWNGRRLGRAG